MLALPLLNVDLFPINLGWRLAFGLGAVFGLAIMLVRKNVPESPRWVVIHGKDREAEALVDDIERQVMRSTGVTALPPPHRTLTIRQRRSIGIGEVIAAIVKLYPSRTIVGLALFIGQAFLYNAIFFTYALVLTKFYGIPDDRVPLYLLPFAIGNEARSPCQLCPPLVPPAGARLATERTGQHRHPGRSMIAPDHPAHPDTVRPRPS